MKAAKILSDPVPSPRRNLLGKISQKLMLFSVFFDGGFEVEQSQLPEPFSKLPTQPQFFFKKLSEGEQQSPKIGQIWPKSIVNTFDVCCRRRKNSVLVTPSIGRLNRKIYYHYPKVDI